MMIGVDLAVHCGVVLTGADGCVWKWTAPRLHPPLKVLVQTSRMTQKPAVRLYLLEYHPKSLVQVCTRHDQPIAHKNN